MKPVIISTTGIAHGWGSDRYKWVSYLTPAERDHVRNGTANVLVSGCRPAVNGVVGTTYRLVVAYGRRFYHRVPPSDMLPDCHGRE